MESTPTFKSLNERFQFVMTLVLFYPVMLQAVLGISAAADGNKTVLEYGLVIGILVLDYLFLEVIKTRILPIIARYTDLLLLLELVAFIPVYYVLAYLQSHPTVSVIYGVAFGDGALAILIVPFIIAFLLGANILYNLYEEPVRYFRKLLDKHNR